MAEDNRIIKSGRISPDLFGINTHVGNTIIKIDIVDSTNQYIKNNAINLPTGVLVVAKEQTAGRGRLSRSWSSPCGDGIWMSFLLRPNLPPEKCSGITLVTALALSKALINYSGAELFIKWPNDIVCKGKKLAGILTELAVNNMETDYVVVGVGINVNTKKFPSEIKDVATSLFLEGAKERNFDSIIQGFCEEFNKLFNVYINTGDMSLLKDEYESFLINKGNIVCIYEDGRELVGKAVGINEEGELLFEKDSRIRTIRAGEVSVRGIYGYV